MRINSMMTSRLSMTMAALALAVVLPLPAAMAADEHFVRDGAAIGGYDVVAYHKAGAPTMGSSKFTAEYQGVTWNFASADNRDAFTASPAKYAPAYGGWCSAGASKGKKVATMPQFWKIVDGQLYLNSSEVAHTKLFLGDTAGVIRKGEMNWKTIYATAANKL